MKVYATKKQIGEGMFLLDIKAEDVPARLAEKTVSTARVPDHDFYRLDQLDRHVKDGHAPAWEKDGSAPKRSSDPSMTVEKFLNRIKADIGKLVAANPERILLWENGGS